RAGGGRGAAREAPAGARVLAPLQVLDGFGLLKNPPPTTQAIAAANIAEARPSADNPPGYYGPAGAPRALKLMSAKSQLKPLPAMPTGVERRVYQGDTAQPIKPQLLPFAWALLFAAVAAVLFWQAGGLLLGRRVARTGTATLTALAICPAVLFGVCDPASAQRASAAPRGSVDDGRAIQATAKVTFGYVLS